MGILSPSTGVKIDKYLKPPPGLPGMATSHVSRCVSRCRGLASPRFRTSLLTQKKPQNPKRWWRLENQNPTLVEETQSLKHLKNTQILLMFLFFFVFFLSGGANTYIGWRHLNQSMIKFCTPTHFVDDNGDCINKNCGHVKRDETSTEWKTTLVSNGFWRAQFLRSSISEKCTKLLFVTSRHLFEYSPTGCDLANT